MRDTASSALPAAAGATISTLREGCQAGSAAPAGIGISASATVIETATRGRIRRHAEVIVPSSFSILSCGTVRCRSLHDRPALAVESKPRGHVCSIWGRASKGAPMPYLDLPDCKLHYKIDDHTDAWTQPDSVLFVHGFTENTEAWRQWVPHFSRRYRMIRIDQRGFGQSGPVAKDYPLTTDRYVNDLARVI